MVTHIFICLVLVCGAVSATEHSVWWEGEDAIEHNFDNRSFAASHYGARAEGLSGGQWLNTGGPTPADGRYAIWEIDVPAPGTYHFWTRKFWQHGPFRWRFDDGEWRICGPDMGLVDSYELATHIVANWVSLGNVELDGGRHRLEIRLLAGPGEEVAACFDAFHLTTGSFHPRGNLRPGQRSGLAAEGWWAFEPPADHFGKEALLDLRHLNERMAGEHGFLRREGTDIVLGDGRKTRLWAINAGPGIVRLPREQIEYLAARLAKLGFNMVRIHGPVYDRTRQHGGLSALDPEYFPQLCFMIEALKRQGIYTKLSFYFPLWVEMRPEDGIPGFETIENKRPFALVFFDSAFQELYRRQLAALLTTPSPVTGTALKNDPAIGIIELVNEDSLFFWTFTENNIPPPRWAILERAFAAWLAGRYGNVAAALAAWPRERQPRDDAAAGVVQVLPIWNLTRQGLAAGSPDKAARMADQARFMADTQRGFYQTMHRFLREELGVRSLTMASNWTTAEPSLMDDAERWTYTATEVIARNHYHTPDWRHRQRNWTVTVGDRVLSRSGLLRPEGLPIATIQYEGHPHILTETAWTTINRYQAEESFLFSTYGSLQGLDGPFFFALSGSSWASEARDLGVNSPACLGQAPAFALQFRRRDVQEGPVVLHRSLDPDNLLSAAADPAAAGSGDVSRPAVGGATTVAVATGGDPLAPYVGRVTRSFDARPERDIRRDLAPYIDRRARTVRSATGELLWNWDIGVAQVDTPRSQGVTGFLAKAGTVALGEVEIRSDNDYGTILVISLDDLPLARSRRILVQVFTEQRMHGYRVDDDGTIRDFGAPPINVRRAAGTVRFLNGSALRGQVLDEHGYARGPARIDGGMLTLPEDSLYVMLSR